MQPGINPVVALNMVLEILLVGIASQTMLGSHESVSAGSVQDVTDKVFTPIVVTFFVASIFWYWFYSVPRRLSLCSLRIIKTFRCFQGLLLCHLGVWMVMASTRYCVGSFCGYRLIAGALAVFDALVYLLASVSSQVQASASSTATLPSNLNHAFPQETKGEIAVHPPSSSNGTNLGTIQSLNNRAPSYDNFAPPDYTSATSSSDHSTNPV